MVSTGSRTLPKSKAGKEEFSDPVKHFEHLIQQRRKSNSPTIEDDFTVDMDDEEAEEEPFDEPRTSPRKNMSRDEEPFDEPRVSPKRKVTIKEPNPDNDADAEIDKLCWTGSDLDGEDEKKEADKSTSMRSLFWSNSDLEGKESVSSIDQNYPTTMDRNDVADQRDDEVVDKRSGPEMRVGVAAGPNDLNKRVHGIIDSLRNERRSQPITDQKKTPKETPQLDNSRLQNKYQNVAVRTETSADSLGDVLDDDEETTTEVDETSTFSAAPSVTKRIRNSKIRSPRSPRTLMSLKSVDEETAFGHGSVATSSIEAGMATAMNMATCSILGAKPKIKRKDGSEDCLSTVKSENEDLLDRFFEKVEGRVCKTPAHEKEKEETSGENEEEGLKRLMNPFLDRLKKYDNLFEQLEEIACTKDDENSSCLKECRNESPAAFAAKKFTELLDQVEKFEPGFAKARAQCDEWNEEDSNGKDDNIPQSSDSTAKTSSEDSPKNTPMSVLEKAWKNAETMVKEQKRTSFDKKDQIDKMKEQFFAARLNWKLRQQVLMEAVKQNTAKAAKTTTEYVETVVSSCHPSMSSTKDGAVDGKEGEFQAPIQVNANDYESGSEAYHDASSVDNSDFLSMFSQSEHSNVQLKYKDSRSNMLSPSEHSNIRSSRRDTRSLSHNITSEDDTSNFSYNSDNVLRSPQNLSTSSRNYSSIADALSSRPNVEEDANKMTTRPLAVISEEDMSREIGANDYESKRVKAQKKKTPRDLRRWAYPSPAYYRDKSSSDHCTPDIPTNPKEWFDKCKNTFDTVYTASERFLYGEQCASATLKFTESNSFEDDRAEDDEVKRESTKIQRENSIVEDDDLSIGVIAAEPSIKNNESGGNDFDDDLSGFETAINETDYDQDTRPPMMRLMKSRDSRSCGSSRAEIEAKSKSHSGHSSSKGKSIHSNSRGNSVHSHLSSELPKDYTLADAIRHASLSTQTNEANRTRVSQEPRGGKLKMKHSVHVRGMNNKPPPMPPKPPKLDVDTNSKEQPKIRSPKSSETNETSDITVDSSCVGDSRHSKRSIVDSGHSRRSIVIEIETPKAKNESQIDDKSKSSSDGASDKESTSSQPGPPVDDEGTVYTYNTNSTGSTSFKDCYQDAIPSLSTEGTMNTIDEEKTSIIEKMSKQKNPPGIAPLDAFLPSDDKIVKSMALLSVTAAVIKTDGIISDKRDPDVDEVESVPSAPSYPKETEQKEIAQDPDAKTSNDVESFLAESESILPLATLHDDREVEPVKENITKNPMIDEDVVLSPVWSDGGNKGRPEDLPFESMKESALLENVSPSPILDNVIKIESAIKGGYVEDNTVFGEDTVFDGILDEKGPESEEKVLSKSFFDSSLPIAVESTESQGDIIVKQSTTSEGASSETKRRSVEDRRRRRLRQRRKFEKVLRGEDDGSSLSSSTLSGSGSHEDDPQQPITTSSKTFLGDDKMPLISASFDTGFQPVPAVVEETQ